MPSHSPPGPRPGHRDELRDELPFVRDVVGVSRRHVRPAVAAAGDLNFHVDEVRFHHQLPQGDSAGFSSVKNRTGEPCTKNTTPVVALAVVTFFTILTTGVIPVPMTWGG